MDRNAWNKISDEKAVEMVRLLEEGMQMREIAKKMNLHRNTIMNVFNRLGISKKERFKNRNLPRCEKCGRMGKAEHICPESSPMKGMTKEVSEIKRKAEEKRIVTWKKLFKEGKIHIWCEGLTGDKSMFWKGGKSFEPYTQEFNKIFKEAIRQRDNLTCLKCNLFEAYHKERYNRKLLVHHIDYDKENTILENCCSLCVRCNSEVNINRPHWTKFFQSLLAERYGYKYTEDGKVIIDLNEVISNEK